MIVLSEDSTLRPMTPSARENRAATEAAKLLGFRVFYMPEDFSACETASNALVHVPVQHRETIGIWIGFIPTPDRYQAIFEEALSKRIRLLNDPEEHIRAQEFDRAYERLRDLTPDSVVVTSTDGCESAIEELGLPVFVKGAVQSRKARGWKACVAESLGELERLTSALLSLEGRTRGRVIVRKLERLRHVQKTPEGFPVGREFRVFIYRNRVLAWSYYWETTDDLQNLTIAETEQVLQLSCEASKRLQVPFVAIDIGQTEDNRWIVIESGDGQFSGYSQIPVLKLWNAIRNVELQTSGCD